MMQNLLSVRGQRTVRGRESARKGRKTRSEQRKEQKGEGREGREGGEEEGEGLSQDVHIDCKLQLTSSASAPLSAEPHVPPPPPCPWKAARSRAPLQSGRLVRLRTTKTSCTSTSQFVDLVLALKIVEECECLGEFLSTCWNRG
eukprot:760234-Hanusia_phi.AAC.8